MQFLQFKRILHSEEGFAMLAKITRGNQVTIPKEIVKQAHLEGSELYLEVSYKQGVIFMKPVVVEERIAPEQYEKLLKLALREDKDDLKFDSAKEAVGYLKKRAKKN